MANGKGITAAGTIIAALALIVAVADLHTNRQMLDLMQHPVGVSDSKGSEPMNPWSSRIVFDLAIGTVSLVALGLNGIAWYRTRKQGGSLPKAVYFTAIRSRTRKECLFGFFADRAIFLIKTLEDAWHQWDNAGEKLIHPIGTSFDFKSFDIAHVKPLIKTLDAFSTLYEEHLSNVRQYLPDFQSGILNLEYPSEIEYHHLKSFLETYASDLKEKGESIRSELVRRELGD
jgi:hypothetical protein